MTAAIREITRVQRALLRWHRAHALAAPWRASGDPYHCLVAAVMAQQTQMSRVLPSYERFTAAFPTLASLAGASRADVIRAWRGMGYNRRAVRLHEAARAIAASGWRRDAASLARIDGVGPFTAAVVASFAFGEPAACVDTNVRRVLSRLAGDEELRGAALQRLADASLPARHAARWNQALMDYGAQVCLPRPKCGACAVASWCASRERYASPAAVAEGRAAYGARPVRREQPYRGSSRYYRGRIIDLLRGLPPGRRVRVARLPALIADGHRPPSQAEVRALVEALERHGLVEVRRGGVSLPEAGAAPIRVATG